MSAPSLPVAETKLITTEDVLVELLTFFSEYGEKARSGAVTQAEGIRSGANIEVEPQSREAFRRVSLYTKHAPTKAIA
jgi:hypothetical protein